MPSDTDWAWLAGFIDGEGCFHFGIVKSKRYATERPRLTFSISQADRQVLDKVLSITGVGRINGPYRQNKGKGHYLYRVTNADEVHAIASSVWSYLGVEKRKSFRRAVHRYNQSTAQEVA